jgi:putative transposase
MHMLQDACADTGVLMHTYCLMSNHAHLMMTPPRPHAISVCIQDMGRRYVRYFNDCYGRTGTLWEGRFRSFLIEGDVYLLTCARYIELNPVRAGMVRHPRQWPWSGYRARAGEAPMDWLSPDPAYGGLADTLSQRSARYCAWVAAGIPQAELLLLRDLAQRGGILGGGSKQLVVTH